MTTVKKRNVRRKKRRVSKKKSWNLVVNKNMEDLPKDIYDVKELKKSFIYKNLLDNEIEIEYEGVKYAGRPSEFSSAIVRKLLEAKKMWANTTKACAYAGISRTTYYDWKKRIKGFADEMEWAETMYMMIIRKSVMKGVLKDSRLAFELLRRLDRSFVEVINDGVKMEQAEQNFTNKYLQDNGKTQKELYKAKTNDKRRVWKDDGKHWSR